MKKIKIKIIFMLLIIAFGFAFFNPRVQMILSNSNDHTRVAIITDFQGDVKVVTSGSSKTINALKNLRFVQGDRLLTGEGSWVSLKIDTDKEVMVSKNTSLGLEELSGSNDNVIILLTLETGKVWTNIKEKLNGNSKYEIKTPTTTIGVRGTKFYLDVTKDVTQLAVLDGTVAVTTKIMSKDAAGKMKEEEITLLVNKNKQISIGKEVVTKEEVDKKIKDITLSSWDIDILKFILKHSDGIDQKIIKEINDYVGEQNSETTLIKEDKAQIKGTVFLPNDKRNTGGGHIHILDPKNNGGYYGLINANGDFAAGDGNIPNGSYMLRADPTQGSEYAGSDEVPLEITNGKANPDTINVHLNNIQLSVTIMNPRGLPVTEGNLLISDSDNNLIYNDIVEKTINIINVGGLTDGSYTMIANPTAKSKFVQSNAQNFTIKNGKSDLYSITLMYNNK